MHMVPRIVTFAIAFGICGSLFSCRPRTGSTVASAPGDSVSINSEWVEDACKNVEAAKISLDQVRGNEVEVFREVQTARNQNSGAIVATSFDGLPSKVKKSVAIVLQRSSDMSDGLYRTLTDLLEQVDPRAQERVPDAVRLKISYGDFDAQKANIRDAIAFFKVDYQNALKKYALDLAAANNVAFPDEFNEGPIHSEFKKIFSIGMGRFDRIIAQFDLWVSAGAGANEWEPFNINGISNAQFGPSSAYVSSHPEVKPCASNDAVPCNAEYSELKNRLAGWFIPPDRCQNCGPVFDGIRTHQNPLRFRIVASGPLGFDPQQNLFTIPIQASNQDPNQWRDEIHKALNLQIQKGPFVCSGCRLISQGKTVYTVYENGQVVNPAFNCNNSVNGCGVSVGICGGKKANDPQCRGDENKPRCGPATTIFIGEACANKFLGGACHGVGTGAGFEDGICGGPNQFGSCDCNKAN